jgi:hypothetical protein
MASENIERTPIGKVSQVEVEDAKLDIQAQIGTHYAPANEAEKELDRKVNWKLDLTVLMVLAISFIVRPLCFASPAGIVLVLAH